MLQQLPAALAGGAAIGGGCRSPGATGKAAAGAEEPLGGELPEDHHRSTAPASSLADRRASGAGPCQRQARAQPWPQARTSPSSASPKFYHTKQAALIPAPQPAPPQHPWVPEASGDQWLTTARRPEAASLPWMASERRRARPPRAVAELPCPPSASLSQSCPREVPEAPKPQAPAGQHLRPPLAWPFRAIGSPCAQPSWVSEESQPPASQINEGAGYRREDHSWHPPAIPLGVPVSQGWEGSGSTGDF